MFGARLLGSCHLTVFLYSEFFFVFTLTPEQPLQRSPDKVAISLRMSRSSDGRFFFSHGFSPFFNSVTPNHSHKTDRSLLVSNPEVKTVKQLNYSITVFVFLKISRLRGQAFFFLVRIVFYAERSELFLLR